MRGLWLPLSDGERVEVLKLRVKRFRCRECRRTWRFLPPMLLAFKRYAAGVVQGCWETWATVAGASFESAAEAWHLRSVRTVQRWLHPLAAGAVSLMAGVRRLLVGKGPEEAKKDTRHSSARSAVSGLLDLTRTLLAQAPLNSSDRLRVPYHFVMLVAVKT